MPSKACILLAIFVTPALLLLVRSLLPDTATLGPLRDSPQHEQSTKTEVRPESSPPTESESFVPEGQSATLDFDIPTSGDFESAAVITEYRMALFVVTGHLFDKSTQKQLTAPPENPRTLEFINTMPKPMAEEGEDSEGHRLLGVYDSAFLFCEFWSVTYAIFLLDCLPRFIIGRERMVRQGLWNREMKILCPGEFFAIQYMVEVFGFNESDLIVLPSHFLWRLRYGRYQLEFKRVYYVSPLDFTKPSSLLLAGQVVRSAVLKRVVTSGPTLTQAVYQQLAAAGHLNDSGWKVKVAEMSLTSPLVMFTEREDMTMPHDYEEFLSRVSEALPSAIVGTVRFETLRVVTQVRLMEATDILVGPSGNNLVNMMFMRRGSICIALHSNETLDKTNTDYHYNQAGEMAEAFGIKYVKHVPDVWEEQKSQPRYSVDTTSALIRSELQRVRSDKVKRQYSKEGNETWWLSPPMIGCENLYHKSKYPHFMGAFKQTYITGDFALKVARLGDWKRLLKEMVMQRNLTEDLVSPALSMCFYRHAKGMYAQGLVKQLGHQGQTKAERLKENSTYWLALAGYLRAWRAHERRGRFLFYCDPGPKNWGISKSTPPHLQMYDFDTSTLVQPGALCSIENDCYCGGTWVDESHPPACSNNRCTFEGMQQKIDKQVHTWIGALIRQMTPAELLHEERTKLFLQKVGKRGKVRCQDVIDYLNTIDPSLVLSIQEAQPCRAEFICSSCGD